MALVMTKAERNFFKEMGEEDINDEVLAAFRAFKPVEAPSPNDSPLDHKKFNNKAGMSFSEAIAKNGGKLRFEGYDDILFAKW
jgi:hypothetical protein